MPEQHDGRAELLRAIPQRRVPGIPSRGLEPVRMLGIHLHGEHPRIRSERPRLLRCALRDGIRSGLQSVVHDGRGDRRIDLGGFEGCGCRQRERVGSTGQGDHDMLARRRGEGGAHSEADGGDSRIERRHFSTVRAGSPTRSGSRR
ncbi:hypothetical protein GCM10025863_21680 [Microbacterium suwonense]|uniref:Uncharacterized protein n=1 Tax=Microbacterium suwonense TaxID=683047 RepID=A0ABM8FVJ6_9MICO|nr:hypothetical protein GCM10025863_21680 [Microbacterium suwonense]